jgi:vancomycin resistance protein YoaR
MNRFKNLVWIIVMIVLVAIAAYVGYRLAFRNLILPNVSIAGINVGGMDKETAYKLTEQYFAANPNKVILRIDEKDVDSLGDIKVTRDFTWAVAQAYGVGRNGNLLTQVGEQLKTVFSRREISIPTSYDADELAGYVDQFASDNDKGAVWPKLVKNNGVFSVVGGTDGLEINKEILSRNIARAWGLPDKQLLDVPVTRVIAKENKNLADQAIIALNKWGEKRLKLRYGDFETTLTSEEMIGLFGLSNNTVDEAEFNTLLARIQQLVETEPKDAVFSFENDKVKQFKPETVGTKIDIPKLETNLGESLLSANKDVLEIPVILTQPKIKTGDVNNLGIKELIGKGKSTFAHSIAGRIFNVNLAASRINGALVAPGEEFSFNETVGDISKASGYQQAYVISGGKTVLGDGGGVCQVSTTVFRAALNAGLPINERKAHAYRVGYYEQDSKPGIDATVYNPTADLKFTNDTGKYILIQTTVDTKKLTMEVDIYGTSDGRKSYVSEPKISSQTAPLPTTYVDDPTLPQGQTKQVDWSAWGAKVSFYYKVTKGDSTLFEKTFYSNYQSWGAVYLKGTKS